MKNIVLVGFMGTGKSAVGRRLSKMLNMTYVSTDDLIEAKEGCAITEIFAKSGEPHFRKVEKEVIKEVSGLENSVIAAGGGVVLDPENIATLKKNGVLFCLNAAPEVIYMRTKKYKHRPLLNGPDPVKKIKELLNVRQELYKKADHQIDTSEKSVTEIAREICSVVSEPRE